ncbi:MAG TPA: Ppx/GppA family phosphatase [Solirubrobacteraceae bacterium]|nr:Ppx/GppA family phosphatase [Solirubrobacteraceae bacterium]
MRAAVIDIGSNSTRLLIADADAARGTVAEVLRRSQVTRLGAGLEATGELSQAGIERVEVVLASYRRAMLEHGADANLSVLTEAVRRATNGAAFAQRVRDHYQLNAQVLTGDQEALLTFLGATFQGRDAGRAASREPTVVIDIGGASTEFVVGRGTSAGFHVSLPVGVVRLSERRIAHDPPTGAEVKAIARDVRSTFGAGLPPRERAPVREGVAVAGTATSAAAIDQGLEPYDPERVHGYRLSLQTVEELIGRTAAMTEAQRRTVTGLEPGRAPTIVAGLIILREALSAFALQGVTVSEHDILFGGVLQLAGMN